MEVSYIRTLDGVNINSVQCLVKRQMTSNGL